MAETLKRIRTALVTRGTRNAVHNLLPVAVAPRVVHVRVPGPLDVGAALAAGTAAPETARAALVAELHARLQGTLDGLLGAIAPAVERWARPNPLHRMG
jgi:hypothetical protein